MEVRKANFNDIDTLEDIFSAARAFMAVNGNPTQWPSHYPSRATVLEDIAEGISYVLCQDGVLLGTFVLVAGPDPTYGVINGPGWLNDEPYYAIHRVAANVELSIPGLGTQCLREAERIALSYNTINLRIDTHENNIPMQKAILKMGYHYCGEIIAKNGTTRFAYHKIAEPTQAIPDNTGCQQANFVQ